MRGPTWPRRSARWKPKRAKLPTERAREIITTAVQRVATDQAAEVSVTVVPLPNDEMKGRIIGRAGRNIRAIERATGVDIVVDDTPEAVTLSSFDPVRREVARIALTKMIQDGRIHPTRIEKLVEDAEAEVERVVKEEGERASIEAGVPGLHPEILKMLGRLRFRTSYGQNQNHHAIETSRLAAILAAELGADVKAAKTAGLLHDIGKAIDHEFEGTHAELGAEFIKRFGVTNPKVLNAIASHHHAVDQQSLEAIIVEVADAISGARPGARRENVETFLRRVHDLEDIAKSQAGRGRSLCHSGRARDSRGGQAGVDRRSGFDSIEQDDCQANRGYDAVSGSDQGDGHS